jgi:phosphoglycolate phosphatase
MEPSATNPSTAEPSTSHTYDFDAFVFDMDGTLLNSLPDLTTTTNITLERMGYPAHTKNEIRQMVGSGVRALMLMAVPEGTPEEDAQRAVDLWRELYGTYGHVDSAPYPGMVEVLDELHARGKKLAVLSNKFDAGIKDVVARYFPGKFDFTIGDGPVPRKPDPHGMWRVAEEFGVPVEKVAYFGDSDIDMMTAHNSGAFGVACTWGYQTIEQLKAQKPDAIISTREEILQFA